MMAFTLPTIGVDQSFLEKLSNPAAGLSDIGDSIVRAKKLQMESEEQSRAAEKHRAEQNKYNNKLALGYAKTLEAELQKVKANGGTLDDATINKIHKTILVNNFGPDEAKRITKMYGINPGQNAIGAIKKYKSMVAATDPRDIRTQEMRGKDKNNNPTLSTIFQDETGDVSIGQPQLDTSGQGSIKNDAYVTALTTHAENTGIAHDQAIGIATMTAGLMDQINRLGVDATHFQVFDVAKQLLEQYPEEFSEDDPTSMLFWKDRTNISKLEQLTMQQFLAAPSQEEQQATSPYAQLYKQLGVNETFYSAADNIINKLPNKNDPEAVKRVIQGAILKLQGQ